MYTVSSSQPMLQPHGWSVPAANLTVTTPGQNACGTREAQIRQLIADQDVDCFYEVVTQWYGTIIWGQITSIVYDFGVLGQPLDIDRSQLPADYPRRHHRIRYTQAQHMLHGSTRHGIDRLQRILWEETSQEALLNPFFLGTPIVDGLYFDLKAQPVTTTLPEADPATIVYVRGQKTYELTNHLGNVMAVVTDTKVAVSTNGTTVDYYLANVISATDYYAFGSPVPGRSFEIGSYRFGFQGMEKDNEISGFGSSYYTEFRQYDPIIGRWHSVDPILQPWMSPYCAMDNNPVFWVDPFGLHTIKRDDPVVIDGDTGGGVEGGGGNGQKKPGSSRTREDRRPLDDNTKNIVTLIVMIKSAPFKGGPNDGGGSITDSPKANVFTGGQSGGNSSTGTYTKWKPVSRKISLKDSDLYGWGDLRVDPNSENCYYLSKAQARVSGAEPQDQSTRIQIALHEVVTDGDYQILPEYGEGGKNVADAIAYINEQLDKGNFVQVGVAIAFDQVTGNADGVTDHFVVIYNRGSDENGNFFQVFENGVSSPGDISDPNNKLYFDRGENLLRGTTSWSRPYSRVLTVTMIIRNK